MYSLYEVAGCPNMAFSNCAGEYVSAGDNNNYDNFNDNR